MPASRRGVKAVLLFLLLLAIVGAIVIRVRDRAERRATKGAPADGARTDGARDTPGSSTDPRRGPGPVSVAKREPARSTVLRAKWGSSPGELGHLREEGAPEGPMSAALAANGDLVVLDQVNGRLQRFRPDGSLDRAIDIGTQTAEDVAIGPDGDLTVVDPAGNQISIFDEQGKPIAELPLGGGPIDKPGGVTAVFSDDTGVYVEREHTEIVRVADADGKADPDRPTQPGRPSRDGLYYLNASILDKSAGTARLRVFDRDANLVWERAVTFPRMILHLLLLDSDKRGRVYLGALIARESPTPPYSLTDVANVIDRFSLSDGSDAGTLEIPAVTAPEEMGRELILTDEGDILQLVPGDDGMEIVRWVFP